MVASPETVDSPRFTSAPCGAKGPVACGDCCHASAGAVPPSWFRIAVALAIAGQAMFLSLGLNNARLAGEGPTFGSAVYWALHGGLVVSCVVVLGLLGLPLARATWQAAVDRRITVEALFSLSLVGALAGSLIASITGQGSIYYEVVAVVLAVYSIGQQFTHRQRERALQAAESLGTEFATARVRQPDGTERVLPVDQVDPSRDRVLVAPGAAISVDGVVAQGEAQVSETTLTGETSPTVKRTGDRVAAGMFALDGALEIQPDPPGERTVDRILQTVRTAQMAETRTQREADRLMALFVPVVVATSALTFLGWLAFSTVPWWQALFHSMAVLLVACPCALGLATPIAIWTGLYTLHRLGLTARNGRILEALAQTDLIVFDKTGTLSEDRLKVADFVTVDASAERRHWLRQAAAAVERAVPHPVARALTDLADDADTAPLSANDVRLLPGQGVTGWVDDTSIEVVRKESDATHTILAQAIRRSPVHAQTKQVLWLRVEGAAVGAFLLVETLRESTKQTLNDMKALGVACQVMTGDRAVQLDLPEDVPRACGLSPEEKIAEAKRLRANHADLIFVGDGLNDAAAMAESSASIALDHGAELTTAAGDAVLRGGALTALPQAVETARRWRARLAGNLRFAAAYNVLGMGLAAAGLLHPVVAAVLMVGSSFFVSLRAMDAAENAVRSTA